MKNFLVDLDYENYLFDQNYEFNNDFYKKIRESFEFVYFIINKDPDSTLVSNINYSAKYLKSLKDEGFCIPKISNGQKDVHYWWGRRKDKLLEEMLNSKITSAKIAIANNWGMFNGILSQSAEEIQKHIEHHSSINEWIIKRPTSFSGIGHTFFNREKATLEFLNKVVGQDLVLIEPAHKRVLDIGTTFVVEEGEIKKMFMVENINSDKGRFRGAKASYSHEIFKTLMKRDYNLNLECLEEITKKIAEIYLLKGAQTNIQIDSFFYEENGEVKLYPLVEVNCRKTMGLVAQSLADHHPKNRYIEWKILTQKEITEFKIDLSEWKLISPEGLVFKSYYRAY